MTGDPVGCLGLAMELLKSGNTQIEYLLKYFLLTGLGGGARFLQE